jgi:phage gp36-like protein
VTYATLSDLVARFGNDELVLLSDDANTGSIAAAVVDLVLGDVRATIDSYLTDRYQLPLTANPAALVPIACDLARFQLATRSGKTRATDQMTQRNDNAIRWLRDVAAGKVGLGLDANSQELPNAGGAQSTHRRREFTDRTLADYNDVERRGRLGRFW